MNIVRNRDDSDCSCAGGLTNQQFMALLRCLGCPEEAAAFDTCPCLDDTQQGCGGTVTGLGGTLGGCAGGCANGRVDSAASFGGVTMAANNNNTTNNTLNLGVNNFLTSGVINLTQAGRIIIRLLNLSNTPQTINARVFALDTVPRQVLRIGNTVFSRDITIPADSLSTISFEANVPLGRLLEVQIRGTSSTCGLSGLVIPSVFLQSGACPTQQLFRGIDFIRVS